MQSKTDLRREMRARLRALGDDRASRSRTLCETLVRRPEYVRARTVAIFDPLPSEPNVSLLWEMAPRRFLYPRIVEDQLQLLIAESITELEQTTPEFQFREPPFTPERVAGFDEIDVILVPGLAFSPNGHRLGRGGGYYDRLLSALSPSTARLGICFNFQLLSKLPTENHDQLVNAVVTD